jgi:hypothetical protein
MNSVRVRVRSGQGPGADVDQNQKQALQVTKEIVVKFIEIGRISPGNFPEFFSSIYNEVLGTITVSGSGTVSGEGEDQGQGESS